MRNFAPPPLRLSVRTATYLMVKFFAGHLMVCPCPTPSAQRRGYPYEMAFMDFGSCRSDNCYTLFRFVIPCAVGGTHPPESQQTIRYYGRYSNKRRGWDFKHSVRPPLMAPQLNVEERKQPMRQPEPLFIFPALNPKATVP